MAPKFNFFDGTLMLHISLSWVKIRLYTENQRPRLSESGLKCLLKFFMALQVFLGHISSSWVEIRLYTKNQLSSLSGSGLKVCCGVGWVS